MSGPMDPERLAAVRKMVEEGVLDDHVGSLTQVLADRDHWEAKAKHATALLDQTAAIVEEACEVLGDAGGDIVELAKQAQAEARRQECNVRLWRGELEARTLEWQQALRERDEAHLLADGRASVLESVKGDLDAWMLIADIKEAEAKAWRSAFYLLGADAANEAEL